MRRLNSAWLCLICVVCVLPIGCSTDTTPTMTTKHSIDVIVEGAKAIADSKVLPAQFCVDTDLDPTKSVIGGSKDAAGWTSESAEDLSYRLLESPKLGKLPAKAVALLPAGSVHADCRHRLAIHEPQFIEVRQRGQRFIYAVLAVDDRCPLCGAGYSIGLRMHKEGWQVDAPDLALTSIS